MDQNTLTLTIIGMMLVTYLPRLLPIWLLAARSLPAPVHAWLRYVPPAVLAAMLFPTLLLHENRLYFAPGNLYLMAAIPTLLVAWKTRSLFGAVMVGMLLVALARWLM